jgi:TPR repeat protein
MKKTLLKAKLDQLDWFVLVGYVYGGKSHPGCFPLPSPEKLGKDPIFDVNSFERLYSRSAEGVLIEPEDVLNLTSKERRFMVIATRAICFSYIKDERCWCDVPRCVAIPLAALACDIIESVRFANEGQISPPYNFKDIKKIDWYCFKILELHEDFGYEEWLRKLSGKLTTPRWFKAETGIAYEALRAAEYILEVIKAPIGKFLARAYGLKEQEYLNLRYLANQGDEDAARYLFECRLTPSALARHEEVVNEVAGLLGDPPYDWWTSISWFSGLAVILHPTLQTKHQDRQNDEKYQKALDSLRRSRQELASGLYPLNDVALNALRDCDFLISKLVTLGFKTGDPKEGDVALGKIAEAELTYLANPYLSSTYVEDHAKFSRYMVWHHLYVKINLEEAIHWALAPFKASPFHDSADYSRLYPGLRLDTGFAYLAKYYFDIGDFIEAYAWLNSSLGFFEYNGDDLERKLEEIEGLISPDDVLLAQQRTTKISEMFEGKFPPSNASFRVNVIGVRNRKEIHENYLGDACMGGTLGPRSNRCFKIALIYSGLSRSFNSKEGRECLGGHPEYCWNISSANFDITPVAPRDYAEAVAWFILAFGLKGDSRLSQSGDAVRALLLERFNDYLWGLQEISSPLYYGLDKDVKQTIGRISDTAIAVGVVRTDDLIKQGEVAASP